MMALFVRILLKVTMMAVGDLASCLEADGGADGPVSCLEGRLRSFVGGYNCVPLGFMALGLGFYLGF